MGNFDPRIDAYIARAPAFARPILTLFRGVVHEGCPDVVEDIKWSMPFFVHHGILCQMAAFKAHCRILFWKGGVVAGAWDGAEQLGRMTSVDDLPPRKTLIKYVKAAATLNESGVRVPTRGRPRPTPAAKAKKSVPARPSPALRAALARNAKAKAAFEGFSPSHRKEYVEWIAKAKTDATKIRRIDQALEWMAAGKSRNWKYARK